MKNSSHRSSRKSRSQLPLLAALLLSALSGGGCANWNTKPDTASRDAAPKKTENRPPTAEVLVEYLNREASKIQLIECKDVAIEIKSQGSNLPGVDGFLVCEKPRNFHLTGKVITQEVDLGSNDELFWYWVKQSPEPKIFYCRYADFDKGVRLPFPFQPEWVLEVLGMADYPDPSKFKMQVIDMEARNKKPNRVYELSEQTHSQGQAVTKVTLINSFDAAPPVPQVIGKELRDAHGQLIAKATIKKTQYDQKSKVVIPTTVVLEYPAQKLVMTLTMRGATANNPLPPEQAKRLFSLPDFTKTVDLAEIMRSTPTSGIRQTGQFYNK